MVGRVGAFFYGVACYLSVFGFFSIRDWISRKFRGSEVYRFRTALSIHRGACHQYATAGAVRRSTQRDGPAMVQGCVDQNRAQCSRAQHIRIAFQCRLAFAVLEMAADGW